VRQAEKIKGHALEPYVDFWRLSLRLEEADPGEVRDFLAKNAGSVLEEQLRRDWLCALGKKGQWGLFREEHRPPAKDDPDVACYALQANWRLEGGSVLAGLKPFLKASKALPEGCAPLVDAMLASGELTPKDLRDRLRRLVQAGLLTEAKRVAERLPADQAPRAGQIDSAAGAPARFLERAGADLKKAAGRELVIVALAFLAQGDPQTAVRRWAMLATRGARRHLPEAVEWFREAGETPLSDEQLAWRVRIALRQENWTEVKTAVERMSPPAQNEPVWVYWLGRSLFALGVPEEGRALLGRIAGEHHFYGRLAAEELGMPLQIPPKAASPTREEIAEAVALPGLKRALMLYRLGLRTEATNEWIWTVRAMDDRALLAAAELARRNGIWDRAIGTADRTVASHDFAMRYLAPYRKVLSKQARANQLEEPYVFGLVRQESRFIADARSSAGAVGLMQLLPSTARWVSRRIGMKGFHPSRANQPEVNAALGTFYLRHVLDEFNGNPILAAAAYNAGPIRARQWCGARALEGAIYIETIPLTETRQYVKKVMANTVYYDAIFGGEGRSLKSRLGTIGGAAAKQDKADK
jgi:soluble lytic murein transglycosylase